MLTFTAVERQLHTRHTTTASTVGIAAYRILWSIRRNVNNFVVLWYRHGRIDIQVVDSIALVSPPRWLSC